MYGLISHVNGLSKKKTKRRVLNILNVLKKGGGVKKVHFPKLVNPIIRAAKRIFRPQGKRILDPSSNSPNNDT